MVKTRWVGRLAVVATGFATSLASGQCNQVELSASDGADFDGFGISAWLQPDVAIVGAPLDNVNNVINVGSAYVYRLVEGAWTEEQKLIASDGLEDDRFAEAVAIKGDVALAGAWSDDDPVDQAGSAYVFRWDGNEWTQEAKLLASDGAQADLFGEAVALEDGVALVGARFRDDNGPSSGAVYVYAYDGKMWGEQQKLLADDGQAGDQFGRSIAIEGDVAVVGAPQDDDLAFDSGAMYVFRFDGQDWVQEQKLVASDGATEDLLGRSVALNGDFIIAGVASDDNGHGVDAGAVYVFRYDGKAWVEHEKVVAADGEESDFFGIDVAIHGEMFLVGAEFDDERFGTDVGSAYLFRWNGARWIEERKLLPDPGSPGDRFGGNVNVNGDVGMVGAELHDGSAESSGAAFIFDLAGCLCPDFNDDGMVGLFDLIEVLSVWGQKGGAEDVDGDGIVGFGDTIFILSAWGPCE